MLFFGKKRPEAVARVPSGTRPAVRKSICTGEMTGGYVDPETGKFHELELIDGPESFAAFCKSARVSPDDVETIY